jgi:release factor glutamine methyltransferase
MLLKDIELSYVNFLGGVYGKRESINIFNEVVFQKFAWSSCEIGDRKGQEITPDLANYFELVLEELKVGRPVQYVLGQAFFYEYEFAVDERVLIPRPETEELVHWIIEEYKGKTGKGLDIGCGSGCIPIVLDKQLTNIKMSSIDVSKGAIEIANENNKKLNASVQFSCLDVFNDQVKEEFNDLSFIVSNPPYITEKERDVMRYNVLKYEPELALFAEGDALGFYRRIAAIGNQMLEEGGTLYFECNEFNSDKVVDILMHKSYKDVQIKQDLQGKNRMVKGIKT